MPLRPEHIKPRLLGHWGTSPGLNLVYAQLNRLIRNTGSQVLYVAGPGHGGPAVVANVYLEGTYSEVYPRVSADEAGLLALVRQFSTPGGIPSHVSVPTPGSIHEGGELGYALMHAFGAAFDNPDLLVACVVGDGEAETAPLEGSWKGIRFLDPARDGAVLPILHLNEHKIAGPTVLGRVPEEDLLALLRGHGYAPRVVAGSDPRQVHRDFAAALDGAHAEIRAIQRDARDGDGDGGCAGTPRWPMIVLRTPKGWTGPREVDGIRVEGTSRSHQVPLACVRENPAHLAQLERWLRGYRPHERFDVRRRARRRARRARARRRPADGRAAARQRRHGARAARAARPGASTRSTCRRRRPCARSPRAGSASCCATSTPPTPTASASSVRTRRTPTASARCSPTRTGCCATHGPATSTSRRTAASWRCCQSTTARAGWRATC